MEVIAIWVAFSALAGYVASQKGRSGIAWFLLSLVLSPLLGLVAALIVSPKRPRVHSGPDNRPAWMATNPTPLAIAAPADALQALLAMRNRGLITADEYESKRVELLARI